MLVAAHEVFASWTGVEEFEIDRTEGERLAGKITKLKQFYPGMVLSPKAMAWIELACACSIVYGPRVTAYRLRRKKERERKKLGLVPPARSASGTAAAQVNGSAGETGYASPGEMFGFQGDLTGPPGDGSA